MSECSSGTQWYQMGEMVLWLWEEIHDQEALSSNPGQYTSLKTFQINFIQIEKKL